MDKGGSFQPPLFEKWENIPPTLLQVMITFCHHKCKKTGACIILGVCPPPPHTFLCLLPLCICIIIIYIYIAKIHSLVKFDLWECRFFPLFLCVCTEIKPIKAGYTVVEGRKARWTLQSSHQQSQLDSSEQLLFLHSPVYTVITLITGLIFYLLCTSLHISATHLTSFFMYSSLFTFCLLATMSFFI